MRRCCLATTALLLLPASASAEQLDYGARSQVGWTDNVYGTAENAEVGGVGNDPVDNDPVDDYSMRLSPWGQLSDPDGEFNWSLRYQPSYERYLNESALDGFDHDVAGTLGWRATDRTTLNFAGAYRKFNSALRFNESADPTDPVDLQGQRQEITGNVASLSLRHALTPRDALTFFSSYNRYDYSEDFSSDRSTFASGTSYLHSLTELTRVGVRASWVQQTISRDVLEDNVTNYYNLSAELEHSFSRTLRLEASAGPTLVDSNNELVSFAPRFGVKLADLDGDGEAEAYAVDADSCLSSGGMQVTRIRNFRDCETGIRRLSPEDAAHLGVKGVGSEQITRDVVQFDSDSEELLNARTLAPLTDSGFGDPYLTYFARLALLKDWERWHAEVAYQRSNNDTGSFGFASVQDSFSASLRWQPARLWNLSLTTAYTLQDQASDAVVPSQVVVANGPPPPGVTSVSQIATTEKVIAEVSDNALTYTTASVAFTVSRQLTRHSSAFFSLYWYDQKQRVELDDTVSGDDEQETRWNALTFWIGLNWQFDTIKL